MNEQLQHKIDRAIKFLKSIPVKDGEKIELSYSGGKDSDVILQLAKEADIPFWAIYKNTTIDPPGTIGHVNSMIVNTSIGEIIRPKSTFFQLIEKKGLPNRFTRFCCEILKEYKVLDKSIIGVRKSESSNRTKRYQEPTECRIVGRKRQHVESFYPILDWTDDDVKCFIKDRDITCAPVYYDENGEFHVERRLGCMCCPMASEKKRIEQFKKYPKMLLQYANSQKKYWSTHPDSKITTYYNDVYEQLTRDIFFHTQTEFENYRSGTISNTDYKQLLEEYFKVKL